MGPATDNPRWANVYLCPGPTITASVPDFKIGNVLLFHILHNNVAEVFLGIRPPKHIYTLESHYTEIAKLMREFLMRIMK